MATFYFTPFPVLQTERLLLRQLRADDDRPLSVLRSDERVNRYINRAPSTTIEEAQQFVEKINKAIRDNESLYWAICLKTDAMLIGTICLWNFSRQHGRGEIGYELHPDHHGKGIVQEAVKMVIGHAFASLQLNEIEGWVHHENIASLRILEKNGFTRNLHREKQMDPEEKVRGMIVYSRLADLPVVTS